jgi:hypothetical protein
MEAMRLAAAPTEPPPESLLHKLWAHLGQDPAELPIATARFSAADRANLQVALDVVLPDREQHGFYTGHHSGHEGPGLTGVVMRGRGSGWGDLGPLEFADVEVGDGRVIRCLTSAVLLARFEETPVVLLLTTGQDHWGMSNVRLQGICPAEEVVSRLLEALRRAMLEHNVFRGRVISLTGTGVAFHALPEVGREGVILPDGTLERLEHHAVGIADHAEALRSGGRHLKRGVLLHGPPGTGKTLTVNYLLTATAGRTTILLTGNGLNLIEEAVRIARDLAPATIVLEDVDLVAQERTFPGEHGLLFGLLNQMDGLAEDADLLFVLTTNRPDVIEPALAARPGRVDLALEVPLPDDRSRRLLLRLYAGEISLGEETEDDLVVRSQGVSGAFIKELMRQAALRAATRGDEPAAGDVTEALDELLSERAELTRRLLGQRNGERPEHGSESMLRAITAAGLPVPPEFGAG